jgi:hypothetical protein
MPKAIRDLEGRARHWEERVRVLHEKLLHGQELTVNEKISLRTLRAAYTRLSKETLGLLIQARPALKKQVHDLLVEKGKHDAKVFAKQRLPALTPPWRKKATPKAKPKPHH